MQTNLENSFIVKNELKDENLILNLTFEFSSLIIDYTDYLDSLRKYTLAKQLIKSGTSIGANSREAQNAESNNDFIHKFKVAAKEADETQYWLELCEFCYQHKEAKILLKKLESISRVINKIITTSKSK